MATDYQKRMKKQSGSNFGAAYYDAIRMDDYEANQNGLYLARFSNGQTVPKASRQAPMAPTGNHAARAKAVKNTKI